MSRARVFGLVISLVALVPCLALASSIIDVTGGADCNGWGAEVTVYWTTDQGVMDYRIQLQDVDGNVLEEELASEDLFHGEGDPNPQTYVVSGIWEGMFTEPDYTLWARFYLAADGGSTRTLVADMDCAVATEGTTWSTVKSLYR